MILYRNRLLFGIIKSIINAVFGVLNKILALFNLQPTLLILLIGLVLYLTGTFEQNPTFLLVFQLIVILSVVYAVISTIKRLLGLDKKVKRSKGAQIVKEHPQEKLEKEEQPTVIKPIEGKPVYFRVKQNPEYVMAEYSDRYELFRTVNGQLKKIRVDYKNGENNDRIF